MPIPPDKRELGAPKTGQPIRCFEGISEFRDTSDAESLHEAIQEAAAAAVGEDGFNLKPGEFKDFEISRIQIRVSANPNVKVYRVEISEAG